MSIFKTKRGFTLIELLVVIAIIGILSSVVLASLNDARLKSRDAKRIADLKQIQLALELFFDSEGGYPTAAQFAATDGTGLVPTYMATLPKDPTTGGNYAYSGLGSTACTSYHLGAVLEQSGNKILDTDIDATQGTECDLSTDFDGGGNADCETATTGTGDDLCYDLKP